MENRAPQTLAVAFPSHEPHPLTGSLEFAVASALGDHLSRPVRVNNVLSIVYRQISGKHCELSRVRRLASGAREWLLQQAARLFWSESGWFQSSCINCNSMFDVPATLASAPRKSAGRGFPVVSVLTSLGQRQFEVPNGLHEEQLALNVAHEPVRDLLGLCGLANNALDEAHVFTKTDIATIEAALEETSPEIADEIITRCPNCQAQTQARIDPLEFAFPKTKTLVQEVHLIASSYHWSEQAILALPTARRRHYTNLIIAGHSQQRRPR